MCSKLTEDVKRMVGLYRDAGCLFLLSLHQLVVVKVDILVHFLFFVLIMTLHEQPLH